MRNLSKSVLALLFLIALSPAGAAQSAFSSWEKRVLKVEPNFSFSITPTRIAYQNIDLEYLFFQQSSKAEHAQPACFVPAFSANDLPFFCKIEYKIDRKSAMNFRFRIQSLDVLERD